MRKIVIQKGKESRLIALLLFLLPFFDVLNGVFLRKLGISGIGSAFHAILLFVLIVFFVLAKPREISKYEKLAFSLILLLIVSSVINHLFNGSMERMSIDRVSKIMANIITFVCLLSLLKSKIISRKTIEFSIMNSCVVILLTSLIANLLNIGNNTYTSSKLGMTGFLTGSNEPIAIYIILGAFLVYKALRSVGILELVLLSINIINLLFVQSKSSYLFAGVFIALAIYTLIKKYLFNSETSKKVKILICSCLALFLVFSGILVGKKISGFIDRQLYIKENAFNNSSVINFVFSGRIDRPELVQPIFDKGGVMTIFQIFFGQGLNFGYYEIFEIDLLDVFLYGGVLCAAIVLLFSIFILSDVWKKTKSRMAIALIIMVFFYSCTAGHVLIGGVCCVYLSLLNIFLMTNDESHKKKVGKR